MKRLIFLACILLGGCAAQQQIALMPRGDARPGQGVLDRLTHDMTVTVDDGRRYRGKTILQTATSTSWGIYSGPRTTTTSANVMTALLVSDAGGQMRCEFSWDALMTVATGVCVDNSNATYDVLIKN